MLRSFLSGENLFVGMSLGKIEVGGYIHKDALETKGVGI